MVTMLNDPDRLGDYIAVALATIVNLIVLGIILHMYLTTGRIQTEFLYVLLGLTAVSSILLFGADKVDAAISILKRRK